MAPPSPTELPAERGELAWPRTQHSGPCMSMPHRHPGHPSLLAVGAQPAHGPDPHTGAPGHPHSRRPPRCWYGTSLAQLSALWLQTLTHCLVTPLPGASSPHRPCVSLSTQGLHSWGRLLTHP